MQGQGINRWRLAIVVVILIGILPVVSWACATCWGADDPLARGLNKSIIFLLSMPFLVGGSIGSILYIAHQRAEGRRWPYIAIRIPGYVRRVNSE